MLAAANSASAWEQAGLLLEAHFPRGQTFSIHTYAFARKIKRCQRNSHPPFKRDEHSGSTSASISDGKFASKRRRDRRVCLLMGSWAVVLALNPPIKCPPPTYSPCLYDRLHHDYKAQRHIDLASFPIKRPTLGSKRWSSFSLK